MPTPPRDEMFETKVRLNVRPLKFAYFLRFDDEAALRRIMSIACTQWGGLRNVIIPIKADGSLEDGFEHFLSMHQPDRFVSYLPDEKQQSLPFVRELEMMFPGIGIQLQDGPSWEQRDHSIHPLSLVEGRARKTAASGVISDSIRPLALHTIGDTPPILVDLAMFGTVYSGQESSYTKHFRLEPHQFDWQNMTIWQQQFGDDPLSSLINLTQFGLRTNRIHGPANDLVFHVIVGDSVVALSLYWNYRAAGAAGRSRGPAGRRVFLLPPAQLATPIPLANLCDFIRQVPASPNETTELDLFISCDNESTLTVTDKTLAQVPNVTAVTKANIGITRWFKEGYKVPREADAARELRCMFTFPPLCTSYEEGLQATEVKVWAAHGENEVLWEPPDRFARYGFGSTAFDIQSDLWDSFPPSPPTADAIKKHAWFSPYGISCEMETPQHPEFIRFILPSWWDGLSHYFSRCGYSIRRAASGRFADSLLTLVGGIRGCSVFASSSAMKVLELLALKSSKKVAQKIIKELRLSADVEQDIVAVLRDLDIVPELKKVPKTLVELKGAGLQTDVLFPLLTAFAATGLVKRGIHASCPHCLTPTWFAVGSISEELLCPGCSKSFPFPVEYPAGSRTELRWEYTLNALLNRVMDQDGLPAMLALRHHLRERWESSFAIGVELVKNGGSDVAGEFDHLFVSKQRLYAGETKASTMLAEKDFATARLAQQVGVHEFAFATIQEFDKDTLDAIAQFRRQLEEEGALMRVEVYQRNDLFAAKE